MNKTVTINISGIIFHIEEDAYETLSKYISTIKGYFSKADGGNEIMSDIESRIAEMLQSKTSAVKQVVLMADVDYVMQSMGKPEEFAGDEPQNNQANQETSSESASNSEQENTYNEPIKKRLYRDGDSKVLGGVCSGVAHYFDIDVVWIRIALVLLFWLGGLSLLIYIVLWIAIPEAKTVGEKFAMKGEKPDINNISKAVKEEAEQLKKRMEKYGQEFSSYAKDNKELPRNVFEKIIDFIGDVLLYAGRVFLKFIAVFLIVIGVILFLALFTSVFGASFMINGNNGKDWVDLCLLDGKDFYLGIIGIALCAGIPIIMMMYAGIKMLLKISYRNRWVNLSAGMLWLTGLLMLMYVGFRVMIDFNKDAEVREKVVLTTYETLHIGIREKQINKIELNMSDSDSNEEDEDEDIATLKDVLKNRKHKYYHEDDYMIGKRNGVNYLLGNAELKIIQSQTNNFELVVLKQANGANKQEASERAKRIDYKYMQIDSLLQLDNLFEVLNVDKIRSQAVTVILKVPVGKTIFLDKSTERIIKNIQNVTDTDDSDMINRRWIMTESGLKCVDCDGLDEADEEKNKDDDDASTNSTTKKKDFKVTVNGVEYNAKDDRIKMDSNGVFINSKEAKVSIDKNGVHIDTKK